MYVKTKTKLEDILLELMLNGVFLVSASNPVGPTASGQATEILTPSPITFGFKI